MMTEFNEKFPELKGMACDTVMEYSPEEGRRYVRTFSKTEIEEHCLSKQRVSKIIEEKCANGNRAREIKGWLGL